MNEFLLQAAASAVGAFVGITGGYYWMRWSGARTAKKIAVAQQQIRQHHPITPADTVADQVRRRQWPMA